MVFRIEWCFSWVVYLNLTVKWVVYLNLTVNGLPYEWCSLTMAPYEWCFAWVVYLNLTVKWVVYLNSTVNGLPYEWCSVRFMVSLHYQWWSFESLNRLWLVFLISGVPYEWVFLWMLFRKSTVNGRPYKWCSVLNGVPYEWCSVLNGGVLTLSMVVL